MPHAAPCHLSSLVVVGRAGVTVPSCLYMFVHTVAATVATMPETTASRDETAVSADFARMTETSSSYYYENSPASAMENRGGRGGDAAGSGQEQQDLQDQHEENGMPHVAEAATEAHTDEHSYRQSLARYYRCMAESCNVLLLGLVLGFACIFTYAWVDAFRKVWNRTVYHSVIIYCIL